MWKVKLDKDTLHEYRQRFLKACRYRNILYFIKNPYYLLRLFLFMAANLNALVQSVYESFRARCFDDFGYYFYIYVSKNMKNRNIISSDG